MNILLVGHEGYLGRGLHSFLSRGHRVIGWDKKEDLFTLDAAVLSREKVELLINLSVMADRRSAAFVVGEPTDEINVAGARHIAKILKGSGISWIQMSTREVLGPVYGPKDVNRTENGYRPKFLLGEGQPYAPTNCYGKSKIIAEFIAESHPQSAVIRLTTCYTDYGHEAGNWVVQLINAAVAGKPVTLTQGGQQFRDPLHIDDLGRLMMLIHERRAFGEKFHAGGGRKNLISLREFVRIADPKIKIERAPGGDYGVAFDNRKALKMTGWEPRILIRKRIPVIAENIRRGVTCPPELLPALAGINA